MLSFCCLQIFLGTKDEWFLSGWYLTQTKITQHPHSFTQWCFIILLSLNLLYVTRLQPFSTYGWIWLNSFCQSLLKFSSSLPLSVWAAIIRCQRLGKLVNNRSFLLLVLGAWSSRWGHQHGCILRKALLQFAQGPVHSALVWKNRQGHSPGFLTGALIPLTEALCPHDLITS